MGKIKRKGKGSSANESSDAVPPWYRTDEGKDTRNLQTACVLLAAGHRRLGTNCAWKHGKPGRKHAVAATPAETGVSESRGRTLSHYFEKSGKHNLGNACQYSHDLADKGQDHKARKNGKHNFGDACQCSHSLADKNDRLNGKGSRQDHKVRDTKKRPNHRPSDRW